MSGIHANAQGSVCTLYLQIADQGFRALCAAVVSLEAYRKDIDVSTVQVVEVPTFEMLIVALSEVSPLEPAILVTEWVDGRRSLLELVAEIRATGYLKPIIVWSAVDRVHKDCRLLETREPLVRFLRRNVGTSDDQGLWPEIIRQTGELGLVMKDLLKKAST